MEIKINFLQDKLNRGINPSTSVLTYEKKGEKRKKKKSCDKLKTEKYEGEIGAGRVSKVGHDPVSEPNGSNRYMYMCSLP